MKIMNNFKDAIIINRKIGIDELVIPFSLEFMIHEDNKGEIYEYLIKTLCFEEFVKNSVKSLDQYGKLSMAFNEEQKKDIVLRNEKLNKQYKNCKTIITIKLELQKYE